MWETNICISWEGKKYYSPRGKQLPDLYWSKDLTDLNKMRGELWFPVVCMDTDVLVERVLVLEGFPALVTAQLLGHHLVDQPNRWQLIAENSVLFYTTVNNYQIIVIGLKLTSENILNKTNQRTWKRDDFWRFLLSVMPTDRRGNDCIPWFNVSTDKYLIFGKKVK